LRTTAPAAASQINAMRASVGALAGGAAQGGRVGAQAGVVDLDAAVGADTVAAEREARKRQPDLSQLVHVARQLGLVRVGDQVGHGFVAAVRCFAGERAERLFAHPGGVPPQLGEQGVAAPFERGLQRFFLPRGQRHAASPCMPPASPNPRRRV